MIQISGRLTPRVLDLTRLSVTDGATTLVGSAHADIALPNDVFDPQFFSAVTVQGTTSLRSPDGAESYSVKGGMARGVLALAVQFDGAPLQRLGITAVQGALSGSGTISGPLGQPAVDVAVSLKQGKLGTDPLSLDGHLAVGPDGFQVRSVSAVYLAHRLKDAEGSVDLKKGTFAFKGRFETEVFADKIAVTLGLNGSYSTAAGPPLSARVFDLGLQGRLALSAIKVAKTDMQPWAPELPHDRRAGSPSTAARATRCTDGSIPSWPSTPPCRIPCRSAGTSRDGSHGARSTPSSTWRVST